MNTSIYKNLPAGLAVCLSTLILSACGGSSGSNDKDDIVAIESLNQV